MQCHIYILKLKNKMEMNSTQVEAIVKQVLSQLTSGTPAAGASAGSKAIPKTARVAMLTGLEKMEIKEFIENFANQFDDTDASVFPPETVFHDLDEYSSLIALSIIAMVDEEYNVTLKGDDMRAAVTIEDLFNTVKAKAE